MGLFKKQKKEDNFPYSDGKDRAAYTCRHIMNKQSLIEYVSHDSNGDWTFLCKNCSEKLDLNNAMIVALCDLYKVADISNYCTLEKNMQNENGNITAKSANEYEEWLTQIKDKIAETNISRNGQLRSDFSGEIKNKKTIDKNVLWFCDNIFDEQGGNKYLFYIKEDGLVSYLAYDYEKKEFKTGTVKNIKNIVTILPYSSGVINGDAGGNLIAIDIEGNVYDLAENL